MHTNSSSKYDATGRYYDRETHKIIYTELPMLYEEVRNTFSSVSCTLTLQHKYQIFIYDVATFITCAEKEYEQVSNIKREINKSLNADTVLRDTELLYRPAIIKLYNDIDTTMNEIIQTTTKYKLELYENMAKSVTPSREVLNYDEYRLEEGMRQCKRKRV
jgi:hypothetical protein